MARPSVRDRALVVRTYDFGEADRIVVLLTREHTVVRGVAKGARRGRSRFGSRLQRLVELDVQLYPGRRLATITGADTVRFFGAGIIDDYDRFMAACAALETAERLAVNDAPGDPFLFEETSETLARLQGDPPDVTLDRFLLRVAEHAGWAPVLFECAQCGRPGPHHAFHPGAGGAVCGRCRPPGAVTVAEETLHLMWLTMRARDADAARLLDVAPQLGREMHRLASAHLQWHLERRIGTLAMVEGDR